MCLSLSCQVKINYNTNIKVINRGEGGKGYVLTDFDGQQYK